MRIGKWPIILVPLMVAVIMGGVGIALNYYRLMPPQKADSAVPFNHVCLELRYLSLSIYDPIVAAWCRNELSGYLAARREMFVLKSGMPTASSSPPLRQLRCPIYSGNCVSE